jgi:CBS domain-containing protein
MVIDYRGEGEFFGLLSLMSQDRSRTTILSVEDTICYQFQRDKVLKMLRENPEVNNYFLKSFFIHFIDRTYEETRRRAVAVAEGERLLFSSTVGQMLSREPVVVQEGTSIQEAAKTMAKERVSSLVILDRSGVPVGIVTDRDLREKVVAKGRSIQEPIRNIMSSPLVRVDASEPCFEALLRMIKYNIHHLLVVEEGTLKGVVTNHDFMLMQGVSPTGLMKELDRASSLKELAFTTRRLVKPLGLLLREGAKASALLRLITEYADKVVLRALQLLSKRIEGELPPYSLFAYDDSGRRELSLMPTLRLGIVMLSPEGQHRVLGLLKGLNQVLLQAGLATEEALAPEHVLSPQQWKALFQQGVQKPFVHRLEPGLLDMRPLRGDPQAVVELKEYLLALARESVDFTDYLAVETVKNRPPLGLFKRMVVEKDGAHKDELNLYLRGIRPIADAVRLFSVEKAIRETSTLERLRVLRSRHEFAQAQDLEQALQFLQMLLLQKQLSLAEQDIPPEGFIRPQELSALERHTLKEAFQLIANVYEIIEKSYNVERVA